MSTPARLSRLHRTVGVFQQMLDMVRSRNRAVPSANGTGRGEVICRQRRRVERLCDHNIEAFLMYIPPDFLVGHVVALGRVRSSQAWGFEGCNSDTLYRGPHPFVFYMPGTVTHITFVHEGNGLYRLDLEVLPLALEDIVGLDIVASFGRPITWDYPRTVAVSTVISDDDKIWIDDIANGSEGGDVCWSDVNLDNYLLLTLSVSRVHGLVGAWDLRFNLLGVTRVATTA